MTGIPYNYGKYLDDVVKMRQRGAISAGEQIKSPSSAGSRGLAKVEAFADGPNQLMKDNDVVEKDNEELTRLKELRNSNLINLPYTETSITAEQIDRFTEEIDKSILPEDKPVLSAESTSMSIKSIGELTFSISFSKILLLLDFCAMAVLDFLADLIFIFQIPS